MKEESVLWFPRRRRSGDDAQTLPRPPSTLMSLNSSNSSLDTVHHHDDASRCHLAFSVLNASRLLLLLPLYVFTLFLAWRQWRSVTSGSHSDVFALHLATMELTSALGMVLYYCGLAAGRHWLMLAGRYFSAVVFFGQIFFQVLTCVECYLAVVHPVAYRGLRNARGVRIRNAGAGCVWGLSFLSTCATLLTDPLLPVVSQVSVLSGSLAVVCFCGVSVLRVLIGPRPGEGGGDKERADQSKRRALVLIAAVEGALLLSVVGLLVPVVVLRAWPQHFTVACVLQISGLFLNLPSEILTPLMFLHRARRR